VTARQRWVRRALSICICPLALLCRACLGEPRAQRPTGKDQTSRGPVPERLVAGVTAREAKLRSGRGYLSVVSWQGGELLEDDRKAPPALQRGPATVEHVRYAFSAELYKEQRHRVYPKPPQTGRGGEPWQDAAKGFDGELQHDWDPYRGNGFVFEERQSCDAETVLLLHEAGQPFSKVLREDAASLLDTNRLVNGSSTIGILYEPQRDRPSHWRWWFAPDRGCALIRTEFENGPSAAPEASWLRRVFEVESYRQYADGVWLAAVCTQKWYIVKRGEKPLHVRTVWYRLMQFAINTPIPGGYFLFDFPIGVQVKQMGAPAPAERVGGSTDELAERVAAGDYPPGIVE